MEYLFHLAILIGIYAILALSLNLVVGYTGLLSVAHAAYFGIGAYTTAIFSTRLGIDFFLALPAGVALACVLALLVGAVLSKFNGDYYALGSLGFNVIAVSIMLNWQSVTRGPLGIVGIPRPAGFSTNAAFLLFIAVCFVLVGLAARFIARSSFGRALKAIREDEQALRVFGYNTQHYKLAVSVIGAGMATVAGAAYAAYVTFIDPTTFTINESIFMLAIIILGGLASLKGSVLGAAFLVLLPEALRFVGFPSEIAGQMRLAVYGALLVALMLWRPQGFAGEYKL